MSDHGKSIKTLAHEALMNSFSYEDSSQQSFTKGYEIGFSVCLSRAERAEAAGLRELVSDVADARDTDEAWAQSERCYDYISEERRALSHPPPPVGGGGAVSGGTRTNCQIQSFLRLHV